MLSKVLWGKNYSGSVIKRAKHVRLNPNLSLKRDSTSKSQSELKTHSSSEMLDQSNDCRENSINDSVLSETPRSQLIKKDRIDRRCVDKDLKLDIWGQTKS